MLGTFFFTKKKKVAKKKLATLQVDRRCAWGVYHAKPDESSVQILRICDCRSSVLCGNKVRMEAFSRSDSRLNHNGRSPAVEMLTACCHSERVPRQQVVC